MVTMSTTTSGPEEESGEGLSVVGRTELLTGEELMVFAVSRGMTLPPGTPGLAERIDHTGETEAITSLATRMLLCRRVGVTADKPPIEHPGLTGDHGLETMLMTTCEPTVRVAVTIGGPQHQSHVVAFSIGRSFTVAQVMLPMDIHVLRACAHGDVRSLIHEATDVAALPDNERPPARFELGLALVERINSPNFEQDELESVLAATTGWSALDKGDQSSLLSVFNGTARIISMLFHQMAPGPNGSGPVEILSWAMTADGDVWRLDRTFPPFGSEDEKDERDRGLVAVRTGRGDIQEKIDRAADTVGVPKAEQS